MVDEIRLETLVPVGNVDAVVRALRASHPYEEPAFDLNLLAAVESGIGQGRIGAMGGVDRRVVIERIKKELELPKLLVAGPSEGAIGRAAVCAGSGGVFLEDAFAGKAELYLTGEIRHHDAVKAAQAGMTIICTLHSNSERAVLKRVREKLEQLAPGISVVISASDRDPFAVI
jgi:putative NIF3 family GTP cyclohydrolase 1 type 2